jgi:hypothetical protein
VDAGRHGWPPRSPLPRLLGFPGGVWLGPLYTRATGDDMRAAVADAVGLSAADTAGQPTLAPTDITELLRAGAGKLGELLGALDAPRRHATPPALLRAVARPPRCQRGSHDRGGSHMTIQADNRFRGGEQRSRADTSIHAGLGPHLAPPTTFDCADGFAGPS